MKAGEGKHVGVGLPVAVSALGRSQAAALLGRWDRIGIGVRCACNSNGPSAVRDYLDAGLQIAAERLLPEAVVQRRMLELLLQTAHDASLPWLWRSVCLEHLAQPLARLRWLTEAADPVAYAALLRQVQRAHDALGFTPLHLGACGLTPAQPTPAQDLHTPRTSA